MTNDRNPKYDLEERTAKFGEEIIKFVKIIHPNEMTRPLISQLIRAATSVGANYCEADCAESRKDFEHKLGICRKESKETKHWLRMMAVATPELKDDIRSFWQEANELNLIFSAIIRKSRSKNILNKSLKEFDDICNEIFHSIFGFRHSDFMLWTLSTIFLATIQSTKGSQNL